MRRNLTAIGGVAAAALAIGLTTQTGGFGKADRDAAPPGVDGATTPAVVPPAPAADSEIARLTAAMTALKADYAALAARLADRSATLAARDAQRAQGDAALAGLRTALAARETEIRALRDEIETLRARFAFDVELAAAKAGAAPAAASIHAVRADAADVDAALARTRPAGPAADLPVTTIHFDAGSAQITPGGRAHAAVAALMLAETPFARVRLVGYADRTGDPARNRRLAERRAEAVAAALVAAGLPSDRIETAGVTAAGALPVATAAGVAEPLNRAVAIFAPKPTT